MKALILALFSATLALAQGTLRTVGIESGIQFGSTSNLCLYGEYQRAPSPTTGWAGSCSNFIKFDDVIPQNYDPNPNQSALQYIPSSLVNTYAVQVIYQGQTYNAMDVDYQGYPITLLNIGSQAFDNYFFLNWVPNVLIPNSHVFRDGVQVSLQKPLYVSVDGWTMRYDQWGANVGGQKKSPVVWAAGYPQNGAQWAAAMAQFFTDAKNLAPLIRLSAHIGSTSTPDWSYFPQIYKDCPGLEKEHFPLTESISNAAHRHSIYNQILNFYWFANLAAPVFANDPPTRVMQWGTDINTASTQDLHTALALYALVRGRNSFFDALDLNGNPLAPSLWLQTANAMGDPSKTKGPQVLSSASGHAIGDGYNLLSRNFPTGIAYYNMSGSSQTFSIPAGAMDWNRNPLTGTLTLADGQGEVVLIPAFPICTH